MCRIFDASNLTESSFSPCAATPIQESSCHPAGNYCLARETERWLFRPKAPNIEAFLRYFLRHAN
jgi:hypothetical protein